MSIFVCLTCVGGVLSCLLAIYPDFITGEYPDCFFPFSVVGFLFLLRFFEDEKRENAIDETGFFMLRAHMPRAGPFVAFLFRQHS
jgi:hypothetical protein